MGGGPPQGAPNSFRGGLVFKGEHRIAQMCEIWFRETVFWGNFTVFPAFPETNKCLMTDLVMYLV